MFIVIIQMFRHILSRLPAPTKCRPNAPLRCKNLIILIHTHTKLKNLKFLVFWLWGSQSTDTYTHTRWWRIFIALAFDGRYLSTNNKKYFFFIFSYSFTFRFIFIVRWVSAFLMPSDIIKHNLWQRVNRHLMMFTFQPLPPCHINYLKIIKKKMRHNLVKDFKTIWVSPSEWIRWKADGLS